ncbi:hypothetical protein KFE98_06935 [bacterium SCSIO 12741]|nr:hypothetical protein KFE98_06935 [bacterium SCSIO 12741]
MVLYVLLIIGVIVFVGSVWFEGYNAMLMTSYIFMFIGVLLGLVAFGAGLAAKPHTIKNMLIGVGALALVVVLGYVLSSGERLDSYPAEVSDTAIRWSGAGLWILYILTGVSVLSIVYAGVARITK